MTDNHAKKTKVWTCKIGGEDLVLPDWADLPMRLAVERAFRQLTGKSHDFNFTGWGGKLTRIEKEVAEMKGRRA